MKVYYYKLTDKGFCAILPKDAWSVIEAMGNYKLLEETDHSTICISKSKAEGVYEIYDVHTDITSLMYEQQLRCYIATMNKLSEEENDD